MRARWRVAILAALTAHVAFSATGAMWVATIGTMDYIAREDAGQGRSVGG